MASEIEWYHWKALDSFYMCMCFDTRVYKCLVALHYMVVGSLALTCHFVSQCEQGQVALYMSVTSTLMTECSKSANPGFKVR